MTGLAGCRHHAHRSAQSDFRMPADFSDPMDFPRRPAECHHRWAEHSVCAALCHHSSGDSGESANLLSLGAVDFGIIVDSAVILVENIFRNFQKSPEEKRGLLQHLTAGFWGTDPTRVPAHRRSRRSHGWTDRLRLILISAMQINKAVLFSVLIIVAAFVPLFTMQGVEGADFWPDGAHLCLRAGGRVDRHVHRHAGAGVLAVARSR